MTREEALRLFVDLSGNAGEVFRTGERKYLMCEVVKEAFMNSDNHIHAIEDQMVEALSALTGMPAKEWVTIDDMRGLAAGTVWPEDVPEP